MSMVIDVRAGLNFLPDELQLNWMSSIGFGDDGSSPVPEWSLGVGDYPH